MSKAKFERNKPHVNIGTMGHIDHGKTTLTAAISKTLGDRGLAEYTPFDQIDKAPEEKLVVSRSLLLTLSTKQRIVTTHTSTCQVTLTTSRT